MAVADEQHDGGGAGVAAVRGARVHRIAAQQRLAGFRGNIDGGGRMRAIPAEPAHGAGGCQRARRDDEHLAVPLRPADGRRGRETLNRPLDEAPRQPCEQERHRNGAGLEQGDVEHGGPLAEKRHDREQRPVPQVQRIAEEADQHQDGMRQHPAVDSRAGGGRHQHRARNGRDQPRDARPPETRVDETRDRDQQETGQ